MFRHLRSLCLLCLLLLLLAVRPAGAQALRVLSISPSAAAARTEAVQQLVVRFSHEAAPFGDAAAHPPYEVHCSPSAAGRGAGRWLSPSEWVFEFADVLPPGVQCSALPQANFTPAEGRDWAQRPVHSFDSGGPRVLEVQPPAWHDIEEDQAFVLRLNGPATLDSVLQRVWCASDGVGERVPVRALPEAARQPLLQALGLQAQAEQEPLSVHTLQCTRRFAPEARVQLVYGPGVASPRGALSQGEQRWAFEVRRPFELHWQCERLRPGGPCLPMGPIQLNFSAPVPRSVLQQLRLHSADGRSLAPRLDDDDADPWLERLVFDGPLPARARLELQLPSPLRDISGRSLSHPKAPRLHIDTDDWPPLAKFGGGAFGVIERFAEGPNGPALLPLHLRHVQGMDSDALQLRQLSLHSDADIIHWFTQVQRYQRNWIERPRAYADTRRALPPRPADDPETRHVETRQLSLLASQAEARDIALPSPPEQPRPDFELVGLPLDAGFHVLELTSQGLGQALLDPADGPPRPMHVRTSALVTNLAVHFKLGRSNALAWVTALDTGLPVPGAVVQVSDCRGRLLRQGRSNAQGIVGFDGLSPEPPDCQKGNDWVGEIQQAYFVSARARQRGMADMAFTWSSWDEGIEPWRFNVPSSTSAQADVRAHTVLDRSLLRAGERLSMKHLLRNHTAEGFGLPSRRPDTLRITHVGSGQQFEQALSWRRTDSGGLSAESHFDIPPAARLGRYQITLHTRADQGTDAPSWSESLDSGQFRVEAFRLPLLEGRVGLLLEAPLVAPASLPVQVQLNYLNGGPARDLPVQLSALTRPWHARFAGHEDFSFSPPEPLQPSTPTSKALEANESADTRLVADALPLTLDAQGLGQLELTGLPAPTAQPRELVIEASYTDPGGEGHTLRSTHTLWPADLAVGLRTESWMQQQDALALQAVALDLQGQPRAGVALKVQAVAHITTTSRKRLVGGFYSYDNQRHRRELGTVCQGVSDAQGRLACTVDLAQTGEIELIAQAQDAQGRAVAAATTVWVTGAGELWFGGQNHDRMDLLAERKDWRPGDTARLQVRMPYRQATALLTVEREGLLHAEVVQLSGRDPTIELPIRPEWGPNVYVSVLALRGRVQHLPWYSFFSWGYKNPRSWWQSHQHQRQALTQEPTPAAPPTALIDLAKPSFRLGLAELNIASDAHRLQVEVQTDQPHYPVRGQAEVRIQARLPDGQPAAHAEIALAVVDQALLELAPNPSWQLLQSMESRRAWGVRTATAQMQVVGRRHYGRKALPPGGDGGAASPTRELLDTLVLWQPRIVLDAQGRAQVTVPLNDSLSAFQVVAVADWGSDHFGTGQARFETRQDLQIISALPPLARRGDQLRAELKLRNTTARDMRVQVQAQADGLPTLPTQTIELPAASARPVHWDVRLPAETGRSANPWADTELRWQWQVQELDGPARDALISTQRLEPAVPLQVHQASLQRLTQPRHLLVAPPQDALPEPGPKAGGVRIGLQARLADGLPGVRRWLEQYPYTCLEQSVSQALGLSDATRWQRQLERWPTLLDTDGLAHYFAPRPGNEARGSDTLTAWLVAATHEAARTDPRWQLPEALLQPMLDGLSNFVSGRITRRHWSPQPDLDVRKLAAIEALSRHGRARADMLDSLRIAPEHWPTHALIDWHNILRRVPGIAQQPRRLALVRELLEARLLVNATRLDFASAEFDAWWWLMADGDVNAARLLLAILEDPDWAADWGDRLPRLVTGLIGRQHHGAWGTTSANLWGTLALQRFSQQHESDPVNGWTEARLGPAHARFDWAEHPGGSTDTSALLLPWGDSALPEPLELQHSGSGAPWLSLQALAAVPLSAPSGSAYRIERRVTAVRPARSDLPEHEHSQGDLLRIELDIHARQPMTWVAITDPVPAGATILGSGLGRDAQIDPQASQDEHHNTGWLAYEERDFNAFRSYWEYLPAGLTRIRYTLRLNSAGHFQLPPTVVEPLYLPEGLSRAPNLALTVHPATAP